VTSGTGDGDPVDLRSLYAVDALFDRFAERAYEPGEEQDAAVRLLRALLADVESAEEPREPAEPVGSQGAARRSGGSLGVRSAVAAGLASAVLAAGGVAAGWEPGEEPQQPGHRTGAGVKGGPGLPEPGQERPPDSRPSSLSITPST